MPIFQYKCECGHEFEKLVHNKKELHKWCNYCNTVTQWMEVKDPHHPYYRDITCSICLGSKTHPPLLPSDTPPSKENDTAICPQCGKCAEHIMVVERRGNTSTGPNVQCSSIGFRFNYMEPT